MNNKRLLTIVAVTSFAIAAVAFMGFSHTQMDVAQAFQGEDGDIIEEPEETPKPEEPQEPESNGDGGRACELAEDDPRIGDAAVAPVDAPPGLRFLIGACPAYTAPNGDVYSAGSLVPGDQHPVNGFSTDGDWTRITIGCQSLWVQTSCGQVINAAEGLGF